MSSQLQHKLQQFEATPPKNAWSAIEERLNNANPELQERLYNYETTPPAGAWNAITATLDNATSIENAPVSITNSKWFRYAVAAVILGIVALSILTYAVNKPETTIAKQPVLKQESYTQQPASTPETSNTSTVDNRPAETITPIKEESISVSTASTTKNQSATVTKHYKVVAKEDGQIVRLSQKAYAVFDCAVKGAAQKSVNCKENIQTMQAKMASSMASPTTDFAGLIDMIKSLEENE